MQGHTVIGRCVSYFHVEVRVNFPYNIWSFNGGKILSWG